MEVARTVIVGQEAINQEDVDEDEREEIPRAQADFVVEPQRHEAFDSGAQTERLSLEQLLRQRSKNLAWKA
jgi:hypothetical protein